MSDAYWGYYARVTRVRPLTWRVSLHTYRFDIINSTRTVVGTRGRAYRYADRYLRRYVQRTERRLRDSGTVHIGGQGVRGR